MRPIYFLVGLVSLGLGVVGILLPILPTTPFLLLSIACFSRSSKRFENWLYHTKMYQIYVADFRETGSIAKERKKKIIVSIYIFDGHFYIFCSSSTCKDRSICSDNFYHLLLI